MRVAVIDCGSRLAGIPDKVEMSAEEYLNAFRIGVKSSFMKKASEKDIEKMREKEIKEREEAAEKFVDKSETDDMTLEEIKDAVVAIIKNSSGEQKEKLVSHIKEYEPKGNPNRITDLETLKKLYSEMQSMVSESNENKENE